MDRVANLTQRERAELFEQTASQRGFHPAIAEKDFWLTIAQCDRCFLPILHPGTR